MKTQDFGPLSRAPLPDSSSTSRSSFNYKRHHILNQWKYFHSRFVLAELPEGTKRVLSTIYLAEPSWGGLAAPEDNRCPPAGTPDPGVSSSAASCTLA